MAPCMRRNLLGLILAVAPTVGMRTARPWSEKPWCETVEAPEWPLAYQKYKGQAVESKGRVNSNAQDMRHKCVTHGGESKCHVCEEIEDGAINYQLQGVAWEEMAHNVPTVTDSPWAVGGSHRFDFGNPLTTQVCVMLSGRNCLRPSLNASFFPPPPPSHPMPNALRPADAVGIDYSNCTVRCWGYGWTGADATSEHHLEANYYEQGKDNGDTYRTADGDSWVATDVWAYPTHKDSGSLGASSNTAAFPYPQSVYGDAQAAASGGDASHRVVFNPQGFAYTMAGDGVAGYRDGAASTARFRAPQDVAVDQGRNVYVADTGNHCVRRVSPSGIVATVAGICGAKMDGYHDGTGTAAKFSSPSGITVYYDWHTGGPGRSEHGELVLFVADTDNHRIRRIDCADPKGTDAFGVACLPYVSCWAGTCGNGTFSYTATHTSAPPQPGLADGHGSVARFDSPRGLEASADGTIYVADTNNHLLRVVNGSQFVFTLAGHVESLQEAAGGDDLPEGSPLPGCPPPCVAGVAGNRDGNLTYAEFAFPADVTLGYTQFNDSITDLDRATTIHGGNAHGGSTYSGANAAGSSGGNWSILVVDAQRIRRVTFPAAYAQIFWGKQARFREEAINHTTTFGHSNLHGIRSCGMVRTVAGQAIEGDKDGQGSEASFHSPEGIAVDASGRAFVVDAGSCRVRRLTYANQVAQRIGCTTSAVEVLRPSGCSSYDPPVDARDLTVSPAYGNLYYNYADRMEKNHLDGDEPTGRSVRNCVGSPPPDKLDKHFWNSTLGGDNLVIDDGRVDVNEDTQDSTTIKVMCAASCAADLGLHPEAGTLDFGAPAKSNAPTHAPTHVANNQGLWHYATTAASDRAVLRGNSKYSDDSSICLAALHSGALLHHEEGMVVVTLERGIWDRNSTVANGTLSRGVLSESLDVSDGDDPEGGSARLFSVSAYPKSLVEVQSIAGRPGAQLQDSCGFGDGQPPQAVGFNIPQGASLFVNATLSDREMLFVADSGNHRIRALSAVCSQVCENGGTCVGSDTCDCPAGWKGYDCTLPECSPGLCGPNQICTAPDTCSCAPGYGGPSCLTPLCVQECLHGGICGAPDTCSCPYGWWDANCSTPVCSQTCGNGGNCTSPDKCSCPSDWQGVDCREPICDGHDHTGGPCLNGGSCVAPGTCLCPPQWHGPSCSLPVCTQGSFLADPSPYLHASSRTKPSFWRAYSPCAHQEWCNATHGFDCGQLGRSSYAVEPLWGAKHRNITGRATRPSRCMRIEIGEDVWAHFQYVNASQDRNAIQMYGVLPADGFSGAEIRAELHDHILTRYARYTPKQPFTWQGPDIMAASGEGGEAYEGGDGGAASYQKPARQFHTRPWYFLVDRQVAAVELRNFTAGVYVCANGGNCSAPDTCRCAPGWAGFDCRTPICDQGYYVPLQERFVAGTLLENEVSDFDRFLEPKLAGQRLHYAYLTDESTAHYGTNPTPNEDGSDPYENMQGLHPMWEYSNPNYTKVWEYFVNKTHRAVETRLHGNERYLGPLSNDREEQFQGGYHCSIRSFTQWEQAGAPHGNGVITDHPNYYSRYMDRKVEDDGNMYTNWTFMEWPPVHAKTAPLSMQETFWEGPDGGEGVNASEITYVYTNEGHRLDGIWRTYGTHRRGDGSPWSRFDPNTTPAPGNRPQGHRVWEKGTCIVEFNRTCSKGPLPVDLQSGLAGVMVQDTDLSYRPRVGYNYEREWGRGAWDVRDRGECVDHVVRGCFNNGTCVAPNTCACAQGWTGSDCSVPTCAQTCHHNGECTHPNTCTCEVGWEGHDCTVPQCAQQCLNGGTCVAPDTCQCVTYETEWYDRRKIPRPLFQKPNGDPMLTGYTGFDCSVPICSMHSDFVLNVPGLYPASSTAGQSKNRNKHKWSKVAISQLVDEYREFGAHGHDGGMECDSVRCPRYNEMVSANIGESFEGGCGFDPLFGQRDSWGHSTTGGCCVLNDAGSYNCRACQCDAANIDNCASTLIETVNNFTCDLYSAATANNDDAELDLNIINRGLMDTSVASCTDLYPYCQVYECNVTEPGGCSDVPSTFFIEDDADGSIKLRLCGPTDYQMTFDDEVVYRPSVIDYETPLSNRRTKTSGSFLCGQSSWEEGDYIDDGELNLRPTSDLAGLGIQYGADGPVAEVPMGRHTRLNYNNVTRNEHGEIVWGVHSGGEGIYVCAHDSSCLAPEMCSCTDGYGGFDCNLPLCRHLRPYDPFGTRNVGEVTSCAHGAPCVAKDDCQCITTASILWKVHPTHTLRGTTGWMGTDCSTAICSQGYYDPFCTDVAPGGEGCYRCSNGGNCTAPDVCVCAEGWTGFDCRTPVCESVADSLTRWQLNTMDEEKIHAFESDPCGMNGPAGYEELLGVEGSDAAVFVDLAGRGECVLPNECMCGCRHYFNPNRCHNRGGEPNVGTTPWEFEGWCEGAWQDDLIGSRNVLEIFEKFGTRDCYDGYEGHLNEMDRFTTCHLTIVVPTQLEYISLLLIILAIVMALIGLCAYNIVRKRIKRKALEAKIKRRAARKAVDDVEEKEEDAKGKKGKGKKGKKGKK